MQQMYGAELLLRNPVCAPEIVSFRFRSRVIRAGIARGAERIIDFLLGEEPVHSSLSAEKRGYFAQSIPMSYPVRVMSREPSL